MIKHSALIRCCRCHAIREPIGLEPLLTLLAENFAAQIDTARVSVEHYAAPLSLVRLLPMAALWIVRLLFGELLVVLGVEAAWKVVVMHRRKLHDCIKLLLFSVPAFVSTFCVIIERQFLILWQLLIIAAF